MNFAGESHMLEHQGVWLNLSDGTLTYEEQILELSKNERKILQTLLENPGGNCNEGESDDGIVGK